MPDPIILSIDEIRASTEILSPSGASATVVKVGQYAVKFAFRIDLIEAENQKFVSQNSNVPTPKILATMTEPETGCDFIVMEYVEGRMLGEVWNSLSDGIFWTGERDPATSGPFETEEELLEGMIRRLEACETAPAPWIKLMRKLVSDTLQGHHAVFTHGDLQPKNILVRKIGTKEDGRGDFKITIIDWENSGWYPDYWEFCNTTLTGRFKPDWLELAQQIMPVYAKEYLMIQAIRNIVFW